MQVSFWKRLQASTSGKQQISTSPGQDEVSSHAELANAHGCSVCLVTFFRCGLQMRAVTRAQQTRGDGTWTCILCASDGPARQLTCDGMCRACEKCYFRDAQNDRAGDIAHKCCRTAEEVRKYISPGHKTVLLPDVGCGKEQWLSRGQPWQDGRTIWSIESPEELATALGST